MDFSGLPLGALDQVALACMDLLQADEWLRAHFGGDVNESGSSALTGTASITPGSTTLTGVGTLWNSTEKLGNGDRLVLGDQVMTLADDPASDTEVELESPVISDVAVGHVAGLVDQEIYKAARGRRTAGATVLASVAPPYWIVFADPASYDPEVGGLGSDPSVTFAAVYDRRPEPRALGDSEGTWAALMQYVVLLLRNDSNSAPKLQVPRFGNTPLVDGFDSAAPGQAVIPVAENESVFLPAIKITWRGRRPVTLSAVTQRW